MQKKYIARVINNVDPLLGGRVQFFIPHLMYGFTPSDYPWARQDRELTSDIPEIGDLVWIWFYDETYLKKAYYGNKVNLQSLHSHNQTIGSMTSTYPTVKYFMLTNTVAIGMSSVSPEISIFHPTAEIYINPTGQITITGTTIAMQQGTENAVLGVTLQTLLNTFLGVLAGISPGSEAQNAAALTAIQGAASTFQSSLSTILSQTITLS